MAETQVTATAVGDATQNVPAPSKEQLPSVSKDTSLAELQTTAKANPFRAVAMILEGFRKSLEGTKANTSAPRWMRIARIREFQGDKDYISKGVTPAVKGLNTALWYLMGLTLDAKDYLIQADAGKALWEVGSEMLKVVTSDDFALAITQIYDAETQQANNPLKPVNAVIDVADKIISKIPDPQDLELIAQELFKLLSVKLADNSAGELQLDLTETGKIRLIQFSLAQSIEFKSRTTPVKTVAVTYLGGRNVWKADAAALPKKARAEWDNKLENKKENIYEFNFNNGLVTPAKTTDAAKQNDIEEIYGLLDLLGYVSSSADKTKFSDDLEKALKDFQQLNNLTVTGKVDNATLNRLTNFNFDKKTIERALSYDATKLSAIK
ncbi:MAG: peptidoglycan-binding domain-containing protein [Methylococcaceae bacterium]